MRRAQDQLAGVREQPVGDLEPRVALADDEDPLPGEGVDRTLGDIHVVRHVLDTGGGRAPRFDHPDGEDHDLGPVLAVAGAEHERAVVLTPGRLPGAVVSGGDPAAVGERGERPLHLLARGEVVVAVHELVTSAWCAGSSVTMLFQS